MRHGGDGEDLCPPVIWSVLLTEAGHGVQQLVCFSYSYWTYTVVCLPGARPRSRLLGECKQIRSQTWEQQRSTILRKVIWMGIMIKTTILSITGFLLTMTFPKGGFSQPCHPSEQVRIHRFSWLYTCQFVLLHTVCVTLLLSAHLELEMKRG